MGKNVRMTHDERVEMLLSGAIRLVKKSGWDSISRDAVAAECGCAKGMIHFTFKTMDNLRDAVVQHAIDHHEDESMLHTIAKALACGNEVARNAPKAVKTAALKLLM